MRKTRSVKEKHRTPARKRQTSSEVFQQHNSKRQTKNAGLDTSEDLMLGNSMTEVINISSHHSDVMDKLHGMQKEGKFCDIKLRGKTGHVMAHRLVLIAASPFFYEKLEQKEGNGEKWQSFDLKHIPLKTLKDIVCFIYSGKTKVHLKNVKQFSKYCQSIGLTAISDKLARDDRFEENTTASTIKKRKVDNESREPATSPVINNNCVLDFSRNEESPTKRDARIELAVAVDALLTSTSTCNFPSVNDTNSRLDTVDSHESARRNINSWNNKVNETSEVDTSDVEDIGNKGDVTIALNTSKVDELQVTKSSITENQVRFNELQCHENKEVEIPSVNVDTCTSNEDFLKNHRKNTKRLMTKAYKQVRLCCKKCTEVFSTQAEKMAHKKVCIGSRPRRRCILCKISFATVDEYTHHRNTDVKCLQIRREKHTKRLERKAQLRSKFVCRVCPRKFRRVADHVDHEFTAHDLPYDKEKWPDLTCEWCTYKTMNPWRLHHHQTYDCSKGNQYVCDICGNNYKNGKTLKCHKEMMHTDAIPMLPCDQCGKSLKGPKGLEYHIQIMHKGENPHKRHMCHMCSMKYSSSSDLTFHLHRTHNQPLPDGFLVYTCKECGYMINHKRVYEKHLLLHDDRRDFTCDKCDKSFKTRGSLQTHLKSHIGKKIPCPYDNCKYEALKKCHLKTHIENQHTKKGVKNEKCHVCSYSTFFKGNLIKHLRTVHQLEVVTRYSVQMKAKYKDMKTGDIVGEVPHPDIGNKQVNYDKTSGCKDHNDKQRDSIHVSNMNMFNDQRTVEEPSQELTERAKLSTMSYTASLYNPVIARPLTAVSSHQPVYANCYTPGTVGHMINTDDQSNPSGSTLTHIATSVPGYSREVIQYESGGHGRKDSAGVTYHSLFQEQSGVDNSTKMLTYIQI